MINFVRGNKKNVGLILIVAVVITWLASGWAAEQQLRQEQQALYQSRIEQQAEVMTGLMAANAILMGTWQNEKQRTEEAELEISRANGRLGPMQRKINDLETSVNRMRNNWTSELEVGR